MDKLPEIVWPVTNKTKLVLIEGEHYTAYIGRRKIVTVKPLDPFDAYWIEQFRKDPAKMIDVPLRSA